jgi:ribokinase
VDNAGLLVGVKKSLLITIADNLSRGVHFRLERSAFISTCRGEQLMSKQPYVVVVGSTMIDMVTYTKKVPSAGETVVGDSFALGFGGKGANQAVMARRLGATVSMVNTLGNDVFGDTTLSNFQEQGIDITFVLRTSGASGVAPIWVEPDGSNRIICVPGANNAMTPAEAKSALESLKGYSVVIGQLEIPQAVTTQAFATARSCGALTVLNPAPFAAISPELISLSDWIIPNESEFAGMHPQGLEPTSDEIILQLATTLKTRFAVTLGDQGAAFTTLDGRVERVSAPKVTAIDTTGAGDAFVGAFSVGLALGMDERRAIALGCACASDSVTRLGTQSSYPTATMAEAILHSIG